MMNVTSNLRHAKKKPRFLLLADRLSGELPPGTSDESLLQVLTRYGADGAFLIGSNKQAVPRILAGAVRGEPITSSHPLGQLFRAFIGTRAFEFRHYLTCSKLPVSRELLMRHFPGELHAMLALRPACRSRSSSPPIRAAWSVICCSR
jgi:hypothetical protein